MTTITREWLLQTIAEYEANRDEIPFGLDTNSAIELQAFKIALASLEADSDSHPAPVPLSNDRLHRIREILSKAAAQSDGGNIGYAMSDAVKAIDELLEARKAEPMAWLWTNEQLDKQSVSLTDPADEENTQDAMACGWKHQPLYTAPPAPVVQCPFPCGWDNLNKYAIQDAAFVACGLVEGEVTTEAHRRALIMNNDRLLKVISACRAAMLNGGKS
ncbi:hypothetical protein [Citrobacter sp. CK195]|uniref:hypothetical protein n=1 Tax=Citrobacter sp. CK195 TaxID=2985104 RepID=UPI002576DF52|nr:hypothetical protein [Citrobacter sp. CK195]MDM2993400.1 hypothetical protein [Citrobacter sp. CK195]